MPGINRLNRAFLIAATILLAVSVRAGEPARPARNFVSNAATTFADLEFASVAGQSLRLDLFLPSGPGPFPVIVSVHGGSWTSGTRDQGTAILQVGRGYAVANIDYRLAPEFTFPSQIEDVKASVRWLRANAARFNLNPNAIAVMGYSAGGQLAALLGTSADVSSLEGQALGNAGYSSRVSAVVDYFGPTDLLQLAAQAPACEPGDPNDPSEAPSLFIGCPIQSCPEKTESANPITYVTPDDPPFLILHGLADCLVPWQQSQILYDALTAAGVEAKLVLVPAARHADFLFLTSAVQNQVDDFLDRHLRSVPKRLRPVHL
ncbi:MAG: alpha/beta hydrolase [Acidobacteriota bacterium]